MKYLLAFGVSYLVLCVLLELHVNKYIYLLAFIIACVVCIYVLAVKGEHHGRCYICEKYFPLSCLTHSKTSSLHQNRLYCYNCVKDINLSYERS